MATGEDKYGGRVTAYLKEHGWCQGWFKNPITGESCLAGAIRSCWFDIKTNRDIMGDILSHIPENVLSWNDKPGRTVEEVYELLRKVGA